MLYSIYWIFCTEWFVAVICPSGPPYGSPQLAHLAEHTWKCRKEASTVKLLHCKGLWTHWCSKLSFFQHYSATSPAALCRFNRRLLTVCTDIPDNIPVDVRCDSCLTAPPMNTDSISGCCSQHLHTKTERLEEHGGLSVAF